MSKKTKVYLLVECEVERSEGFGDDELKQAAIDRLWIVLEDRCDAMSPTGGVVFKLKQGNVSYQRAKITKAQAQEQTHVAERLMQAVIEYDKKPAIERWKTLIDRGAIDEQGNVLIKGPYPFGEGE